MQPTQTNILKQGFSKVAYLNNKSHCCDAQMKVIFYKSVVMPPKILKVFLGISNNYYRYSAQIL